MCALSLDTGVKQRPEFGPQLGSGNGRSFPNCAAAALPPYQKPGREIELPANRPLCCQPGLQFCVGAAQSPLPQGGPCGWPDTALICRIRAWCSPDVLGERFPWVSQDTDIPFLSTAGNAGIADTKGAMVVSMQGTQPLLQAWDGLVGSVNCTTGPIHLGVTAQGGSVSAGSRGCHPCRLWAVVPVATRAVDQRSAIPAAVFQHPKVLGLRAPTCTGCTPRPCGRTRQCGWGGGCAGCPGSVPALQLKSLRMPTLPAHVTGMGGHCL